MRRKAQAGTGGSDPACVNESERPVFRALQVDCRGGLDVRRIAKPGRLDD
jgi:hypothetical protein